MKVLTALMTGFFCFSSIAASPPNWVLTPMHTWTPRLGGGMWYQEGIVVNAVAPILSEFPRPVLIGLRSDRIENGYRFDTNTFHAPDSSEVANSPYNYWTDRYSQEKVMQTLLVNGNVEFIWSMPTPDHYAWNAYADAYKRTGEGYQWQTPEYYAAYLQYLIGPVTMTSGQYNALNPSYNFFNDD